MNAERFKLLADAYGADLDRWPANERDAAVAFMGEDPDAPVWLADAESLDRLLDQARSPAPSAVLREQIIAAAPRARAGGMRRGAWMSGAGLAAACVLGVVVGASVATSVILAGVSLRAQRNAERFLDHGARGNVSGAELENYRDQVGERDGLRTASLATAGSAAVLLIATVLLYQLDHPLVEQLQRDPVTKIVRLRPLWLANGVGLRFSH